MKTLVKEKVETAVALMESIMIDPDIDVEYFIPQLDACDTTTDPYILVKYCEDGYIERKFSINEHYAGQSIEEIANYLTFSVEQFKEEVDAIKYGM